jgi:hypothetical protein
MPLLLLVVVVVEGACQFVFLPAYGSDAAGPCAHAQHTTPYTWLLQNYAELMRRCSTWLRPGGQLFVHIFCHKANPYHFEVMGKGEGATLRVLVCWILIAAAW